MVGSYSSTLVVQMVNPVKFLLWNELYTVVYYIAIIFHNNTSDITMLDAIGCIINKLLNSLKCCMFTDASLAQPMCVRRGAGLFTDGSVSSCVRDSWGEKAKRISAVCRFKQIFKSF